LVVAGDRHSNSIFMSTVPPENPDHPSIPTILNANNYTACLAVQSVNRCGFKKISFE